METVRTPLLESCLEGYGELASLKIVHKENWVRNIVHAIKSSVAVIPPVLCSIVLSSFLIENFDDPDQHAAMSAYMVYDDGSSSVGEAAMNALVLVLCICCMTFAVVGLLHCGCQKFLFGYLVVSVVSILCFSTANVVLNVLQNTNCVVDSITFSLFMYNFGMVGALSIFTKKGIPSGIYTISIISIAVVTASNLSNFPKLTTWILLVGLACYDIFAVLSSVGPLHLLIKVFRTKDIELPRALIYETTFDSSNEVTSMESTPTTNTVDIDQLASFQDQIASFYQHRNPIPDHQLQAIHDFYRTKQDCFWADISTKYTKTHLIPEHSAKLGLGDFIFYSVLVALAGKHSFTMFVTTCLVVFTGLIGTILLLAITQHHALPALPISIFAACLVYFISIQTLMPFLIWTPFTL